jgi:hypothetical protein
VKLKKVSPFCIKLVGVDIVSIENSELVLKLGFSHNVALKIPAADNIPVLNESF